MGDPTAKVGILQDQISSLTEKHTGALSPTTIGLMALGSLFFGRQEREERAAQNQRAGMQAELREARKALAEAERQHSIARANEYQHDPNDEIFTMSVEEFKAKYAPNS